MVGGDGGGMASCRSLKWGEVDGSCARNKGEAMMGRRERVESHDMMGSNGSRKKEMVVGRAGRYCDGLFGVFSDQRWALDGFSNHGQQ